MSDIFNIEDLKAEKADLDARKEEMAQTLEGCDWCCGGGDREIDEINTRLYEIEKLLEQHKQ